MEHFSPHQFGVMIGGKRETMVYGIQMMFIFPPELGGAIGVCL
jgi:hypothetical protein